MLGICSWLQDAKADRTLLRGLDIAGKKGFLYGRVAVRRSLVIVRELHIHRLPRKPQDCSTLMTLRWRARRCSWGSWLSFGRISLGLSFSPPNVPNGEDQYSQWNGNGGKVPPQRGDFQSCPPTCIRASIEESHAEDSLPKSLDECPT